MIFTAWAKIYSTKYFCKCKGSWVRRNLCKKFQLYGIYKLKLIYKPISFSLDSPDSSEVAPAGMRALSTEDRTCILLVSAV